jgi:hypothetical protein
MEIVTQKDVNYKNRAHESRVNHQLWFLKLLNYLFENVTNILVKILKTEFGVKEATLLSVVYVKA